MIALTPFGRVAVALSVLVIVAYAMCRRVQHHLRRAAKANAELQRRADAHPVYGHAK